MSRGQERRAGGRLRRRPGRRLLVAIALVATVLVAVVPSSGASVSREARLPRVVNAPGTWSGDHAVAGPIAAVGIATRMVPTGIFDAREELSYFVTSALDGSSTWLEQPEISPDKWGFVGGVTVSPDGRWLGWVRFARRQGWIEGWSVMDTLTGKVRDLEVQGYDAVRATLADLAFSGDSRYLLTSFVSPDQPRRTAHGHQFVAWSVADGTPAVLEEPGHYWLPSLGNAEHGVVWSRSRQVFHADPQTGVRDTITLPRTVLMASWAPHDAAFAYIGRDDRGRGHRPSDEVLYVGATPATAVRVVHLPKTSPIGEFLAWRDSQHVVVGNYRQGVYVVDIRDGSFETIDMAGEGEQLNTAVLAAGLWARPLGAAAAPTGTSDPRQPWRLVGALVGVVLAAVAGARWWRRRRLVQVGPARRQGA